MKLFIWVMLALFTFEIFIVLFMLETGKIAKRTPVALVITAVLDVCMIVWAVVLLT